MANVMRIDVVPWRFLILFTCGVCLALLVSIIIGATGNCLSLIRVRVQTSSHILSLSLFIGVGPPVYDSNDGYVYRCANDAHVWNLSSCSGVQLSQVLLLFSFALLDQLTNTEDVNDFNDVVVVDNNYNP